MIDARPASPGWTDQPGSPEPEPRPAATAPPVETPSAGAIPADGRPPGMRWDYDRPEMIADGIVHAAGVLFALAGATWLVARSAGALRPLEIAAVLVYAIGLVAMLGFSAAYNMWPVSRRKWWLRRFDHSAIYFMIAATYTPFMTRLQGGSIVWSLGLTVWITALVGIVLKLRLPGRLDRLAVAIYLLMGWISVLAYDVVVASLSAPTLFLLAAGGLLYSTGVIFYLWQSLRFHNAIWHVFVLAAAVCHYGAVLHCMLAERA